MDYLEFAKRIAKQAGGILLQCQYNCETVNQKDRQDIATTADLESEKFLIDAILKTFPQHGIVAEEAGEINTSAEYKWIIDPLDGTKEYVRLVPHWNCALALEYKGETIVSVIYRPHEKVMYSAEKGKGSYRNDKQIGVSKVKSLADSFVYCYLPSFQRQQDKYEWAFEKLKEIGKKVYRLRSAADENSALCWLASGGCEAYVNFSNPPKYHDIAPGLLIAQTAGAFNTTNKMPLIITNNRETFDQIEVFL